MMLDELQRRNYAQSTVDAYISAMEEFAKYFKQPPDRLGPEHIRQFQLHLIRDRELAPNNSQTADGCSAVLLCPNSQTAVAAAGVFLSEDPGPAADDPRPGRSHPPDRCSSQPVASRHAYDS